MMHDLYFRLFLLVLDAHCELLKVSMKKMNEDQGYMNSLALSEKAPTQVI
jgi:hypothetical protein